MTAAGVPAPKKKTQKIRLEFWNLYAMSDWNLDELQFMKQHYQKTFDEIDRLIALKSSQALNEAMKGK